MASPSTAYLDALGIDVWVRRDLLAARRRAEHADSARDAPGAENTTRSTKPASNPTAERAAISRPPADMPAEAPVAAPVRAPAVAFTIRCVRFGRVLALIDEPLWRDIRERRFLLDVARAMHGSGRVEREVLRFDWPQLRSGDAGIDAARRAFRAYLETQVAKDKRLLGAGARVRELIGADLDEHIYLDCALRGLTEKKSLWRRIQQLS